MRDGKPRPADFAGGQWYWAGSDGRNDPRMVHQRTPILLRRLHRDGDGRKKDKRALVSGDMATGWVKDGRSWYYLDGQGPWSPAGSVPRQLVLAEARWPSAGRISATTGTSSRMTVGAHRLAATEDDP